MLTPDLQVGLTFDDVLLVPSRSDVMPAEVDASTRLTRGIPLPLGVIGHEGSTIIVVLLGLRLLIWRRDNRQTLAPEK